MGVGHEDRGEGEFLGIDWCAVRCRQLRHLRARDVKHQLHRRSLTEPARACDRVGVQSDRRCQPHGVERGVSRAGSGVDRVVLVAGHGDTCADRGRTSRDAASPSEWPNSCAARFAVACTTTGLLVSSGRVHVPPPALGAPSYDLSRPNALTSTSSESSRFLKSSFSAAPAHEPVIELYE